VGRPARHFAFPNESATPALTGLAASAGYRTACGGVPGQGQDVPPIVPLRRAGMHEGMSAHGGGHDDAVLALGLLRSARSGPA
jgi:hypothetical protein